MREWEIIIPGVHRLYVRFPANQRSASRTGFHTVRGGFDPGDYQVVGVVKLLKYF